MRLIDADSVQVELECAPFYKCNSGIMRQIGNGLNKQVTFSEKETLLKWKDILAVLDESPTIEAEPVRHGRWEWYEEPYDSRNPDGDYGWRCSCCKQDLAAELTLGIPGMHYAYDILDDPEKPPTLKRCLFCGAKMGGG